MKAPIKLVYNVVPREPLIEKLMSGFEKDCVNKKLAVPPYNKVHFALVAKTPDGRVAGQISGYTAWDEMHLSLLAASPDVKVKGTGITLLHAAEKMAREMNCTRLALDTYSWQARPFYERYGFTLFGEQKNYPVGHEKYFLEKVFAKDSKLPDAPAAVATSGLKVHRSDDVNSSEQWLFDTLDNNTQSRKIPGVEPYVKTEFALEARLPDGAYAGGTAFETLWNDLHVSFLGVNTDALGNGIGGTILRHIEEIAKEKQCTRISLETQSWQAQPFYERHGFKQFGFQKDYPPGFARIYLEKTW